MSEKTNTGRRCGPDHKIMPPSRCRRTTCAATDKRNDNPPKHNVSAQRAVALAYRSPGAAGPASKGPAATLAA